MKAATANKTDHHHVKGPIAGLVLAALGIVFGDIGTSPLYALKTMVHLAGDVPTAETVIGLLSLVIWTLLILASTKYITFLMQVDNKGEGGILSLMALLGAKKFHRPLIVALALCGAALVYSDGAITPAISVLSALEGLEIAAPILAPHILIFSVVILIMLFMFQSRGTEMIGRFFGPVMIVWFVTIGVLGVGGIMKNPNVLVAFNPVHGLNFLTHHGRVGYLALAGVFLCITGAEALYADMGHVGKRSIRIAWYGLVLPSLLLNYAGQAALLLTSPEDKDLLFFALSPKPLLFPLVILSTAATIIASQSLITGAFSMTRQAIQLGWCPRLKVTQTSSKGYGQIYIGTVNWLLMIATITLALSFGSSDRLASAYGIAVSFTMILTTCLFYFAAREVLGWNKWVALALTLCFFTLDGAFLGANLEKILEGGWVTLMIAITIFVMMRIWKSGTMVILRSVRADTMPATQFLAKLEKKDIPRVPGTAVFLTRTKSDIPPILTSHVKRNKALHEHVLILSVATEEIPVVEQENRLNLTCLTKDFWRGKAHYGFMESPDIPELLKHLKINGCDIDLDDITYYVGRETLLLSHDSKVGLPAWQEPIFAVMQRNSNQTPDFFNLPHDRVVEISRWVMI